MQIEQMEVRRAKPSDARNMAQAHRESIEKIGPAFYRQNEVTHWLEGVRGDRYIKAMEEGEVFFIATANVDGKNQVLGFASDYRREGSTHGTSVYVRGDATRKGIGSALYRQAELHALASGAKRVQIEASLAGVEFYKAHGFVEVGRGEIKLESGRPIAVAFMEKELRKRPQLPSTPRGGKR